jgi:MoxR-like ATPase
MGNSTSSALEQLLQGRASASSSDLKVHLSQRDGQSLPDKMRQAYFWIINNAVICPYYDLQYGSHVPLKTKAGDTIRLHSEMSYSSYVLIPLLTLFTRRRALMIGGPGRGKTTSAVLMALLSGMSREDVRRSILRGHPQLSISDLLGAPLPSDMLKAEDSSDIRVSWRKWITSRVKIIDEYNRIPTKTQSALLSLMADGYAEMYDQYVYAGKSSWFLTANDDAGGGTFQVIDALKDRIDVIVRAVPFNSGFIQTLLSRVESGSSPEELVPQDIIFTDAELDEAFVQIQKVGVPPRVLQFLGFLLGQLDFCRMASAEFENMSKDTLHLSGKTVGSVCNEDCPLDKKANLCTQTENGISARVYLTALHFTKALAYFRGKKEVELEDIRQIVPWVLHEKLKPNLRSPFFEQPETRAHLQDRVVWIRALIDQALVEFHTREGTLEQVRLLRTELEQGLEGVSASEVSKRLQSVTSLMKTLTEKKELTGAVYEMLVQLKSFHSRYQNYALWLRERESASTATPSPSQP